MPEISHGQFHQMAKELATPDGGYSVSTTTGRPAKKGYMVSQQGHEQSYGPNAHMTGGAVSAHAAGSAEELAKPSRFAGGWHNPETHEKDLDVSRRYTSHDKARSAMWANDQDALYNSKRGSSERNFAKLGTKGSAIGHFLHADPDPPEEYDELKRAAKDRHR
jgi:hypothetical protein